MSMASQITKLAIIAALMLGAIVHSSEALSCWQCNSVEADFCMNVPKGPVTNVSKLATCYQEMYKECPDNTADGLPPFTFCRRTEQTIQGKKRVVRSCGWEKAAQDCYMTKMPNVATKVCQCFTDGCNSASSVGVGAITIILALAIQRFLVNNY